MRSAPVMVISCGGGAVSGATGVVSGVIGVHGNVVGAPVPSQGASGAPGEPGVVEPNDASSMAGTVAGSTSGTSAARAAPASGTGPTNPRPWLRRPMAFAVPINGYSSAASGWPRVPDAYSMAPPSPTVTAVPKPCVVMPSTIGSTCTAICVVRSSTVTAIDEVLMPARPSRSSTSCLAPSLDGRFAGRGGMVVSGTGQSAPSGQATTVPLDDTPPPDCRTKLHPPPA